MKARFMRVIIFSMALVLFLCTSASAENKGDIKFDIQIGYGGVFKFNNMVPAIVEVENGGGNIAGELQAEIPNTDNMLTIYSVPVSISRGTTKKYQLDLPLTSYGNITFNLTKGKDVIYRQKAYISGGLSQNTYFIGILSDDFDSVNYFTDARQDSESVKLDEDNFPESIEEAQMFNAIVVNNFDTSKLDKKKYEILKEWVRRGGLLIIGTGPSYSKSLSAFKDGYITAKIGGIKKISTNALYSFVEKSSSAPLNIDILDMDIEGSIPLIKDGNNNIALRIGKGRGNIVVSLLDFGLKPISDWDGNKPFASNIIAAFPYQSNSNPNGKYGMGSYSLIGGLKIIPDIYYPNPMLYLLIFGTYIFLIGPVNYLVLKKKDRREFMWFTVPALSIVFAFVMYIAGSSTRMNKPIANIVSIMDLSNGGLNIESYAGIFTPYKGSIKVQAGDGMDIKPPIGISSGPGNYNISADKAVVDSKYIFASKTTAEFYKNKIWDMRVTGLDINIPKAEKVDCSVNYADGAFAGSVKNDTCFDFDESYIIGSNWYISTGSVKKGKTKEITSSPVDFNSPEDLVWSIYPVVKEYRMSAGRFDSKDIFKLKQASLASSLIQYIITSDKFKNIGMKFVALSRSQIEGSLIVNDNEIKKNETLMVISNVNATFKKGNEAEYPKGYLSPVSTTSNFKEYNPYDNSYMGKGDMEVDFKVDGNVSIKEVHVECTTSIKPSSNAGLKEYLWDNKTSSWEEKDLSAYNLSGQDISRYISGNVIKIRIVSANASANIKLPQIAVKGSAK